MENNLIYNKNHMKIAIKQARKAFNLGEVPIGCVISLNNKIIAKAYNKRTKLKSAIAHAEIIAIQKACKKIGDWRLENCIMYVSLEPCPMCAGAILQARIPTLVIASKNPKFGCAGSIINLLNIEDFNHQTNIINADSEEQKEASQLLTDFFKNLRKNKIKAKSQFTKEPI